MSDFDINELCKRASVTPRTVHFYVQQGLLPPAGAPGPGARYTEGHVSRIKLIRLLQKQHQPLAEIAKRIKGLSDEQVSGVIDETRQRRSESRGSALDYIRNVLSEPKTLTAAAAPAWLSYNPQARLEAPASVPSAAPARSQWERFSITDGIELHVRRPQSRLDQRRIDKLMTAARTIFDDSTEEEQ